MSAATPVLPLVSSPEPVSEIVGLLPSEKLQQDHYEQIAEEYEAHYGDRWSLEYRRRFIYAPMFQGINIAGARVLDAMCGSGQVSEYLLAEGGEVIGLDISSRVVETFNTRWADSKAFCRSLLDSGFADETFDCVSVVGGLHHIQPNVSDAISEAHRILKPGGYFCFMEPHTGSFPDIVRRIWYKHDRFFSKNEEAIDLQQLKNEFRSQFSFKRTDYLGNIAFLLVLNSLIFRIPLRFKPLYASTLMRLEAHIQKAQGRLTSCFVVGQWQKLTTTR